MLTLGKLNDLYLYDSFFDSFRLDYKEFNEWFLNRLDHSAYYFLDENKKIRAFLKLKIEDVTEDYSKMSIKLKKRKRLKICSFKSNLHSKTLLKEVKDILDEEAKINKVSSIYITTRENKVKLIKLLKTWGFSYICNYKNDKVYEKIIDIH